MTPANLKRLCDFVEDRSGIILKESKAYLIESRLTPLLDEFGFADVERLAAEVQRLPRAKQDRVIDAMTTNETFFFRDKTPFDLFDKVILPSLLETKPVGSKIRIWCAAASTGQEPYSLAMLLKKRGRLPGGRTVEIVATDISPTAIARAKEGSYSQFEVQRGLSVQMLMDFFEQDGTNWQISDELRKMVRFSEQNLLRTFSHLGEFDIVFCRNVLIYFDPEAKSTVLNGIHRQMKQDGFLVMGASETTVGYSERFTRAPDHRGLFRPTEEQQRLRA